MAFETRDPFLIRQVDECLFYVAIALGSAMITWQVTVLTLWHAGT